MAADGLLRRKSCLEPRNQAFSGLAGEYRIDQRRDFHNPVGERDQEEDERQKEHCHIPGGVGRRMRINKMIEKASHYEYVGIGDDWVEGVLQERLQPVDRKS